VVIELRSASNPPMNSSTETINLLLIDDHEMFREGLARSFEKETGFRLATREPVTVLLDVDLGKHRGLEFVEAARRAGFKNPILVLTAGISGQEALQLMQAGVAGIVHKHRSTRVLCEAIRKVVTTGEAWLEEEYVTALLRSVDRTHATARPELSERDRTIVRYILEGLTNREIGAHVHLSEGAVKASLRMLFEKLGVRTRTQLVKVALEQYKHQL
jgi:two-component system, NarL family, nitrate/nitrite response regulator NarL